MPRPTLEMPLFPTEEEIARELFGPAKAAMWKRLVPFLEKQGFPCIDPVFERRYWPAIRRWLDNRYGIAALPTLSVADGKEDWSCAC